MMSDLFTYTDAHRRFFTRRGEKVEYRKGQTMIWPADKLSWVYFIDVGVVKVSCFYADASESIFGYFFPGQAYAQTGSFFKHRGGADLELTATGDCVVWRVPQADFWTEMKRSGDFNRDFLTMQLANQMQLIDRVVFLGENSLERKFALWLLFMNKFYGQPQGSSSLITVPLTQTDIAGLLRVTRESAGKYLRKFTDKGYISISKKHITIKDISKIEKLL